MGKRYWLLEGKRKKSLEKNGLPVHYFYNHDTGREEIVWNRPYREEFNSDTGETKKIWLKAKGTGGRGGRPKVRDREAIKRIVALMEQTRGLGRIQQVSYRASKRRWWTPGSRTWYPRVKHEREITRRQDYQNLYRFVSKWWPVCQAAYQGGNHDLL